MGLCIMIIDEWKGGVWCSPPLSLWSSIVQICTCTWRGIPHGLHTYYHYFHWGIKREPSLYLSAKTPLLHGNVLLGLLLARNSSVIIVIYTCKVDVCKKNEGKWLSRRVLMCSSLVMTNACTMIDDVQWRALLMWTQWQTLITVCGSISRCLSLIVRRLTVVS